MPPNDDSTARSATLLVARRSIPGTAFLIILPFISVVGTPYFHFYPRWITTCASIFAVWHLARLVLALKLPALYDQQPRRWTQAFQVGAYGSAIMWGSFASVTTVLYGRDWTTLFILMITAGVAAGGMTVYGPMPALLRHFVLLLFVPTLLVSPCHPAFGLRYYFVIGLFCVFLLRQASETSKSYWQSVVDHDLLVKRSGQLESLALEREVVLNSTADAICRLDSAGRISFANPAVAHLTGWPVEALMGRSLHETFHHSHPDHTPFPVDQCPLHDCGGRTSAIKDAIDEFWRMDGTSFPVEYSNTPVVEAGIHTGAVVTFQDITARRAVDRMKDEFVSVVSHELRTPLTSIRGALGLLSHEALSVLPLRSRRMLQIAASNSERLGTLVNDILDLERMRSGHLTLNLQAWSATDLIQQAADGVASTAEKMGIKLLVQPLDREVRADPDRVIQVLTNLLGNAIKFSPRGATVRLSVRVCGTDACFDVHDEGRGIPQALLEAIFEPFRQVDSSDARNASGTGLGLAICRTIVGQHGGRIWAESTPGISTTFFFTLPLSEPQPTVGLVPADLTRRGLPS